MVSYASLNAAGYTFISAIHRSPTEDGKLTLITSPDAVAAAARPKISTFRLTADPLSSSASVAYEASTPNVLVSRSCKLTMLKMYGSA